MHSVVPARAVYVTGTDTGVGKTVACVALLHALRAQGRRVIGMKPVASGGERVGGQWRNPDVLALLAASDGQPDHASVNPFALEQANSPQLAAAAAGVTIAIEPITAAFARLREQADAVVVEGIGGWASSLDADLDQRGVAAALGTPVVMVVGLRLGCQNHARLTARAVLADGLHLAGWIGNRLDPGFEHVDAYLQMLQQQLPAPCLGILPFGDAQTHPAALRLGDLFD